VRDLSGAAAPHKATQLPLGGPVRCSDGPAGSLSDVVIDPQERRVSHLVVESPNGAARLVPAELVLQGPAPGGGVALACTVADLLERGTIRSFSYVGSDAFPEGDARSDIGVEDMEVLPGFGAPELGGSGADLWTGYAVTYDRIPPGSAELRRGSAVVSAEGETIGALEGFLLEGPSLTHVVLSGGAISIESVTAIETDRITVET
jgi:hypothetical protein